MEVEKEKNNPVCYKDISCLGKNRGHSLSENRTFSFARPAEYQEGEGYIE